MQLPRFSFLMLALAGLLQFAASGRCADDVDASPAADQAGEKAERLAEMKRQAGLYRVETDDRSPRQLTLHDEPLLRFDNPVGGVPDGIVVMWKDGQQPAVFAQVFQTADKLWIHECQSLAGNGLSMSREGNVVWEPGEAAGEFRRLEQSPAVAETPARRLTQLRTLARQFTAADDFKIRPSDKEATRHQLRLLPSPVYRYADAERGIDDGAVFAFVHGTDPELFLILEHRQGKDPGWHYALAPMTCWAVEAKLNNAVVWNVEERMGKSKRTGDYHVWIYRP